METITQFILQEDGTHIVEEVQVETPQIPIEDQIAEKEALLLQMYEELEALKSQQNQ